MRCCGRSLHYTRFWLKVQLGLIIFIKGGCSFLLVQKGTKKTPGAASGEHLAGGGAHSHCPLDPHLRGRPPEGVALASGGSEHKTLRPTCLGPLGPARWKLKLCALYVHRLLWHNCGSCRVRDHRRTKQVGRYQAVCDRSRHSQILMAKGPCGPSKEGCTVKI